MNKLTKLIRINHALQETDRLLEKAKVKHINSLKCLIMEIAENKELNNNIKSNLHAVKYANECRECVDELMKHKEKLESMLLDC